MGQFPSASSYTSAWTLPSGISVPFIGHAQVIGGSSMSPARRWPTAPPCAAYSIGPDATATSKASRLNIWRNLRESNAQFYADLALWRAIIQSVEMGPTAL